MSKKCMARPVRITSMEWDAKVAKAENIADALRKISEIENLMSDIRYNDWLDQEMTDAVIYHLSAALKRLKIQMKRMI